MRNPPRGGGKGPTPGTSSACAFMPAPSRRWSSGTQTFLHRATRSTSSMLLALPSERAKAGAQKATSDWSQCNSKSTSPSAIMAHALAHVKKLQKDQPALHNSRAVQLHDHRRARTTRRAQVSHLAYHDLLQLKAGSIDHQPPRTLSGLDTVNCVEKGPARALSLCAVADARLLCCAARSGARAPVYFARNAADRTFLNHRPRGPGDRSAQPPGSGGGCLRAFGARRLRRAGGGTGYGRRQPGCRRYGSCRRCIGRRGCRGAHRCGGRVDHHACDRVGGRRIRLRTGRPAGRAQVEATARAPEGRCGDRRVPDPAGSQARRPQAARRRLPHAGRELLPVAA